MSVRDRGSATALYHLGLALLFTHELDAMTHAEWRLLLGLRELPETIAPSWFVTLHVPLFFAILWLSHAPNLSLRRVARVVVSGFLPLHGLIHWRLSGRAESTFDGLLSNGLIFGAGLCGLAYLVLWWRSGEVDASAAGFRRGRMRRKQRRTPSLMVALPGNRRGGPMSATCLLLAFTFLAHEASPAPGPATQQHVPRSPTSGWAPAAAVDDDQALVECDVPLEADEAAKVKRPRKRRGSAPLSPEELERWAPIQVQSVINCEGRVIGVQVLTDLPVELEARIQRNVGAWRYKPARLRGKPVAVRFNLWLSNRPGFRP